MQLLHLRIIAFQEASDKAKTRREVAEGSLLQLSMDDLFKGITGSWH